MLPTQNSSDRLPDNLRLGGMACKLWVCGPDGRVLPMALFSLTIDARRGFDRLLLRSPAEQLEPVGSEQVA